MWIAGLAAVIVNGRTRQRVDQAIGEIQKAVPGAQVNGVAADLSDARRCEELVAQVPEVEILVNNVGVFVERLARQRGVVRAIL
jgi:short-subunit dehydrogenase